MRILWGRVFFLVWFVIWGIIVITEWHPKPKYTDPTPVTTTTTTVVYTPPSTTSTTTTTTLVTPEEMRKWTIVAQCETHQQWHRNGPIHDGGLGILRWNWVHYGGLEYAPTAHEAEPEEQVAIAKRIQGRYKIPDQDGTCSPW